MKVLLTTLMFTLVSSSAFAGPLQGKCAQAALDAAVSFWADVPDPDENLYYAPVSSKATAPRSKQYRVVLGFYDLNDMVMGAYKVTFEDLATCKVASVKISR